MRKGFTLIELLAVIVILAIIALIAVPIVVNIISDAKDNSVLRSAENYIKAVELSIANKHLKNSSFKIEDGAYWVTKEGDVCLGNLIDKKCDSEVLKVEVDGEKPSGEKIVIEDKKVIKATLKFGDKIVEINNEGKLEVVESLRDRYEKAKKDGDFLGTYDKYVIEKVYNAELGAVVNYEEPASLGYNGKWIILGVDNGKIVLVSTETISTLKLEGVDSWVNGVDKLNNLCKPYANGTTGISARSINVTDLNKLIGYNPERTNEGKIYSEGTDWEYGNTVTYEYKSDGNISYSGSNGLKSDYIIEPDGTVLKTFRYIDENGKVVNLSKEGDKLEITSSYYQYSFGYGTGKDSYTVREGAGMDIDFYSLNSSNTVYPERKGYEKIFFAKDSRGNYTSYWLADKSAFPLKRGLSYGIRAMNYNSISSNGHPNGAVVREKLYHSSQDGNVTGETGAFSAAYGVRPVVYLDSNLYLKRKSDGTYDITTEKVKDEYEYVDENTEMVDIYGNKFTVPTGFKILADDTTGYTKETLDVTKGIVIQDINGNEFVWVPVGKIYTDTGKTEANAKTITLDRYTFDASGVATKYTANEYIETDNVNNFKKSVLGEEGKSSGYGGFYIGRYEARTNSNGKLSTNPNDHIWHYINGTDSVALANSMYATNSSFATELINSYAWDTAIVFIQSFESDRTVPYSRQVSLNNKDNVGIALQGTTKLSSEYLDKARNIYDMAANCAEWTTETKNGSYVYRGADFDYSGTTNTKYCSRRSPGNYTYIQFSFRPVLYLK